MHTYRFPLTVTSADREFLDRQFRAMAKIHNIVVKHARNLLGRINRNKDYQLMLREYRTLMGKAKLSVSDRRRKKELSAAMNAYRMEIGLTEAGLQSYAKVCAARYKKLVSSLQVQKECSRVYCGVEKILFGNGKYLHFKRADDLTTICGKTNTNGVKFDADTYSISWMGRSYPCRLPKAESDLRYMVESLDHPISYCEISRMMFDSGWRYYVTLYLKEDAPKKMMRSDKEQASRAGKSCGIDPGVSSIAVCADDGLILQELAPNASAYEKRIHQLLQSMDRSRRALNPAKYNQNGTINTKNHDPWVLSHRYYALKRKLRTLYRKKAAYIRQEHEALANRIVRMAETIIVEHMNYAALARRSKRTERQENVSSIRRKDGTVRQIHKYKRKKRYGHSIGSRAPSELLTILQRKCKMYNSAYAEIETTIFKASQYDHSADAYIKVPLSQREKVVGGHSVQRDLYSAFLIWNTDASLKHADREKCLATFQQFAVRQTAYIEAMKQQHVTMKQCFGF